jgi:hypothetical protein
VKTKLSKRRKSPKPLEIFPSPRVIKIQKMPMGISVIKVNRPFNLRHLAQRGISRAWVVATTQKSVGTVVGKKIEEIRRIKKLCTDLVYENHPALPKKGITAQISINLTLGSSPRGEYEGSFKWLGNIPAVVNDLDDCGFSDIPLKNFVLPLNENTPATDWIQFARKAEGFVAVEIGNKLYNKYTLSDLKEILKSSDTLQKIRAYVCQIHKVTSESYICRVTDQSEGKIE